MHGQRYKTIVSFACQIPRSVLAIYSLWNFSFRTVEAAAAASESDPAIPKAWRGKRCFVVGEKTAAEVGEDG